MRKLIHNIAIFDGTGAAPVAGAVLVEGSRIAAVLHDEFAIAAIAADERIDGQGGTLMPGMVDAHTHLTWGSSVEKIYHQFILPPEELKVAAWRNARVLLDHGFTSLYSAGALGDGIETDLARALAAGETPGPRLIPSTLERSPEGEEGVETGDVFNGRGPEAMRAFIAYCAAEGVKSVKLVISGEDALKPGSAQDILYTDAEMQAAGEAAKDAGLWIAAHAYTPRAIDLALEAGVRILYHCSFADAAAIDAMVAQRDRIFYAPGPGVSIAALEATPPPHIDMGAMKASAAQRMELEGKLVPELRRRGVRVLIGGDYGFPFNPHGRNARDLEHFVTHFGFTPAEALSAATMLGGQLMGQGDELGLVREGYIADLLLIDGDPTRDVTILQNPDTITMIMQGGRMHKAPTPQSVAA
ncbi:amidohydrolase family protein [Sphingobium sufflavum]|uniref:amidohydrolase family protein n=1 Tax=Sphingobium sufflavum TaxID=1129547 RepID=UPI001F2480D2|nr:amidohydrolase family protein [Sphingobium sufflavum]MCE7798050.1 amidohydrolase family protein [Sphingobium sufflavum]